MATRRVTLQWSSKRWSLIYWGHWTINKSCNLFVRKVGPLRKILHQISKGKKCDRAKVSEKPSGCCEPLLLLLQATYVTSSFLHSTIYILCQNSQASSHDFGQLIGSNSEILCETLLSDGDQRSMIEPLIFLTTMQKERPPKTYLIAELLNHANKSDIRDGPHKP